MRFFAFDEPTPQADRRRLAAVRPAPCARTRHHLDGGVPDSRAPQPRRVAAIGVANHEAIAAAKGGIEALVHAAAAATHAAQGLRINAVAPGMTDTP